MPNKDGTETFEELIARCERHGWLLGHLHQYRREDRTFWSCAIRPHDPRMLETSFAGDAPDPASALEEAFYNRKKKFDDREFLERMELKRRRLRRKVR